MTLNPVERRPLRSIAIESSYGLGETVVGGDGHPGLVPGRQGRCSRSSRRAIADKQRRARGRSPPAAAPSSARSTRSAGACPRSAQAQVRAVAALAKRAEQHYGCPQDVEWALDGDAVLLLQSRPETVWSREPSRRRTRSQLLRRASPDSSTRWSTPGCEEEHRWPRRRPRSASSAPTTTRRRWAAEGWQDLYPYYLTFRDDRREIEEGKFWFADLAHWPARLQALRHDHGRVRVPLPRPVQHAPLPGAAGQRRRLPRPQRLQLHEPGRGARGGDRRARAGVPRACRALLRQLADAARELARQDARA